ncbi:MAG: hypothetical protein OXH01_06405 [Bacteroidetes bacterium]|nr:hypothetical protein [Bacteroidota bacterium]
MNRVHITFLVEGSSDDAWKMASGLEDKLSVLERSGKARLITAWVEEEGRGPADGARSAETITIQKGRPTTVGDIQVQRSTR